MIVEASSQKAHESTPKSYWFVGAAYGGNRDQSDRFLNDGIWENSYKDKYLDQVKSMQPGDRIAIKSSYTRKKKLSFDNQGHSVSVMGIKAIGTVIENTGDGRVVKVDWQPRFEKVHEWYFYTNRSTIWRVIPGDWMTEGLIDFTFNGKDQNIQRFCNAPYWRERYGETHVDQHRFKWTTFYQAIADGLLKNKDNQIGRASCRERV